MVGVKKGIKNEIVVTCTDENGKQQKATHSNIDNAILQRVITEILNKLNAN